MHDVTKLSADTPITGPAEDAFGFSGFARSLAAAIRTTPSPAGLVMAVHGPWGGGKSSLLNLVKYYLRSVRADECPLIIDFNPWWFNGPDQLAQQFLAQFGLRLRNESAVLLRIGELIAQYADALSKSVALSTGISWLDKPINFLLKLLKRKPRDVPELKSQITKLLSASRRRVLFVIDDMDRLTPEEVRGVFKAIKALADFPNVIYLLSFDREVVADALSQQLSVDGAAYLEKIVQADFSLPAIGEIRLRAKLERDLMALLAKLPHGHMDATYWGNLLYGGIMALIKKPRDVVRLTNTLSVTLPPVSAEVNVADYIALEALRVFLPPVHATIRDNKDMFVGVLPEYGHMKEEAKSFHEQWLNSLDVRVRSAASEMVQRIFPRVQSAFGRMHRGNDFLRIWHQDLRVCSPDFFDVYFRFSLPDDHLPRAELNRLLDVSIDMPVLIATLKAASAVVRPEGHSKASDIVDRVIQLKELDAAVAVRLLRALFLMDQDLLGPSDVRAGSWPPPAWRVQWLVERLLEAVPAGDRARTVLSAFEDGVAYGPMTILASRIRTSLSEQRRDGPWIAGFDSGGLAAINATLVGRLQAASIEEILATDFASHILLEWCELGGGDIVRLRVAEAVDSDSLLPILLTRFVSTGSSQTVGDHVVQRTRHLNPRSMERYCDLEHLAARVESLLPSLNEDSDLADAARMYLRQMERVRRGQATDRPSGD